jgi:RNA polymerase sigma-70 factor, ECF subfamily
MTIVLPAPDVVDQESAAWLRDLRSPYDRDAAIARLHDLLLRAARFEIRRRRSGWHDHLAHQAADDAVTAILAKLDDYRGASRFTTWAYKFVLLEVGVKLRRRAWEGREIPLEDDAIEALPTRTAETNEMLRAIRDGIRSGLTPHQREVLVSITLNDVPIDVLAERLGTTRGALYKTLHDARHKLRAHLAAAGFALEEDA